MKSGDDGYPEVGRTARTLGVHGFIESWEEMPFDASERALSATRVAWRSAQRLGWLVQPDRRL